MFYFARFWARVKEIGALQDNFEQRQVGKSFAGLCKGMGMEPKFAAAVHSLNMAVSFALPERLEEIKASVKLYCMREGIDFHNVVQYVKAAQGGASAEPAVEPGDLTAELQAELAQCTDELREKWRYFCETLPFREDVPLSERIEAFSMPALKFVEGNYPHVKLGGAQMFWLMVFTAVLESETYPKDEVNAAREELMAKLAQGGGDAA